MVSVLYRHVKYFHSNLDKHMSFRTFFSQVVALSLFFPVCKGGNGFDNANFQI